VTSQKDQIQSLIADIEAALGSEKPRKLWVRASEAEAQRQTLARAQDYLRSLQQVFDAPGGWGPVDPSTGQVTGTAASGPAPSGTTGSFSGQLAQPPEASGDSPEDVLQALLTEMTFLRSSALEPLRLEMDSLSRA